MTYVCHMIRIEDPEKQAAFVEHIKAAFVEHIKAANCQQARINEGVVLLSIYDRYEETLAFFHQQQIPFDDLTEGLRWIPTGDAEKPWRSEPIAEDTRLLTKGGWRAIQ